jgi:hypothetical protein
MRSKFSVLCLSVVVFLVSGVAKAQNMAQPTVNAASIAKANPPFTTGVAVRAQPTDSTGLLTPADLQELAQQFGDMPARYFNPVMQWLSTRLQLRAQEYAIKPKH